MSLGRLKGTSSKIQIVWSPLARARLQEIRTYAELDEPRAAGRLAARIVSVVETLKLYPHLGRAGAEPGIRELIVGGSPYLILYRVRRGKILIATIAHAAQLSSHFRPTKRKRAVIARPCPPENAK